jgi:hypothetical protein
VTGFVVIALFQPVVWACIANATGHVPPAGAEDAALIGGWKLDDLKALYPWLKLVYPWQMLMATGISFGVCCLGSTTQGSSPDARTEQAFVERKDAPGTAAGSAA